VIFSQSGIFFYNLATAKQPQENGIYSRPNVNLIFTTARYNYEDSVFFIGLESELFSHGLDVSELTATSSITSYASQENVAAKIRNLELESDSSSYLRKHHFNSDDGIDALQALKRDVFSPELPEPKKRAKHRGASDGHLPQ
jgi:hypothetical protein